ncbi:MAG: hypothetical protein LM584_02950 [Desulfurococcaceae archaeon]|nr:hypothetical protein [Desulfurococcaceae archaeon]MCC6060474.1 hypothetical protein [Desulfurococcaceae archaeon]
MRFKVSVPAVLLGSPIPGSENPFLASPIASAIVEVEFMECANPSLNTRGLEALKGALESFWSRLVEGMGLRLCSTLTLIGLEGVGRAPLGGLYASLTSLTLYTLHKFHGDTARVLDVIETASLVDLVETDVSWRIALEALRYSALTGKLVAYRGPLEVYEFEGVGGARVAVGDYVDGVRSSISRDTLGFNVYGALVHLMGEAVLEASLRIKEGSGLDNVVRAFKPIHDGVTLTVYNLKPKGGECLWSPGTPWAFDEICLVS